MKEKSVFTSQITKQCQYQYYKKHPKCHKKIAKWIFTSQLFYIKEYYLEIREKLIHAGKYMYLG